MKNQKNTAPPLSEALRLFRVFHDLSVTELAKRLDVSPGYVSLIESGKKSPNLRLIELYAQIFETTPSAIMFFAEDLTAPSGLPKVKSKIRAGLIKFMRAIEHGPG